MSAKRYSLLGYIVWHGGKWYLRRRLPSARTLALSAVAGGVVLAAAGVAIVRRASG